MPIATDGFGTIVAGLTYEGLTVYVDANAPAGSGDGSQSTPFDTISAAIAYVEALPASSAGYIIEVAAGNYASESITITRPRIHLKGPQVSSNQLAYARIGSVTVNFASSAGTAPTTEATISGFLVVPASGDCLTVSGTEGCTVSLISCNLYCEAGQRSVTVSNTNARLKATLCEFNSTQSALSTISFGGNWLDIRNCNIYPGTGPAIAQSAGLVQADSCVMQGTTGGSLITVSGTSVGNYSNCYLEPQAANSNGFVLSNTAQLTIVQNFFRVPSGTGRCVDGVLGNVVIYALNLFAPTYNNKINPAIGAGLVAASTTPVLA